ncbi:MAG: VWA domain-containing protein [Candidatus Thorarchaeota archaeon]
MMMRRERPAITLVTLAMVLTLIAAPPAIAQTTSMTPQVVRVTGEIIDNYINATYELQFVNTLAQAQEVFWKFPLQTGIRLSNISLELSNATYWGHLLDINEAIQKYNESVQQNKSAILMTQYYGGYALSFNLEAGTSATVRVMIEGLLTRVNGVYTLRLPVAKDQTVQADFDIDLTVRCNYGTIEGYNLRGVNGLTVTYLSDGVRLQHSETNVYVPQDLALTYAIINQPDSKIITYTNGTDEFFGYLLAPLMTDTATTYQRRYVFVIDISGSMTGEKIEQAKDAFITMMDDLTDKDLFNVIAFSTTVSTLWTELHAGVTANIQAAQNWVSGLTADGSTNFYGACETGLQMYTESETNYINVMMVLSDGMPTAGEYQEPSEIISHLNEKNIHGVSISTIAFGANADSSMMADLAAQNDGYFTFIEPGEEASTQILQFYKMLSVPAASNYSIGITGATEINTLSPLYGSPFFNGTEILVTGRYNGSLSIHTSIEYSTGPVEYKDTVGPATNTTPHLERIWAQTRISFLVKQFASTNDLAQYDEIIWLSFHYGIVVRGYTALFLATETEFREQTATLTGTQTVIIGTGFAPGVVASDALFWKLITFGAIGIGAAMVIIVIYVRVKR